MRIQAGDTDRRELSVSDPGSQAATTSLMGQVWSEVGKAGELAGSGGRNGVSKHCQAVALLWCGPQHMLPGVQMHGCLADQTQASWEWEWRPQPGAVCMGAHYQLSALHCMDGETEALRAATA